MYWVSKLNCSYPNRHDIHALIVVTWLQGIDVVAIKWSGRRRSVSVYGWMNRDELFAAVNIIQNRQTDR